MTLQGTLTPKSALLTLVHRLRAETSRPCFSFAALCCLFLMTGCASTSDTDALRSDVSRLRREVSDLQKDMTAAKQQMAGTAKEESFNAIRESQTSLYSQTADVSKDLQVLKGRFDEYKFSMEKTLKEGSAEKELFRTQINGIEARLKELSEKVSRLTDGGSAAKPVPETHATKEEEEQKEPLPKSAKPSGEESTGGDAQKLYEDASTLFKNKKYREAREKFNIFLKQFPKNELADNAQFWIGETYYAEKDFEGAILAYETLLKGYPASRKTAGALLKQGMAFAELDDRKTAKVIFQKLIDKHPDSKEAQVARKKIAEMDKKPPKAKPRK